MIETETEQSEIKRNESQKSSKIEEQGIIVRVNKYWK